MGAFLLSRGAAKRIRIGTAEELPEQGLADNRQSTAAPIPRTVSTDSGEGAHPGRSHAVFDRSRLRQVRQATKARPGLKRYGLQFGPASMHEDALSMASEIEEPRVPAATAKPAAIMASKSAYSAAAAPLSSRQNRVRKRTDLVIT